jgi:hypothetical protein
MICRFCGYEYPDECGYYGCPNCLGEGLDDLIQNNSTLGVAQHLVSCFNGISLAATTEETEMPQYTELENEVINAIVSLHDDGIEYIDPDAVKHYSDMDMKQMRGVFASLIKKGAIDIDKYGSEVLISVMDDDLRERCGLEK